MYRTYGACQNNNPDNSYTAICIDMCCKPMGGTCKTVGGKDVCVIPQVLRNATLSTNDRADIELYKPGTNTLINLTTINGTGTIYSPNETNDLKIKYDNSKLEIKLKNLNLTKMNNTQVFLNPVNVVIPNVIVYKSYEIKIPNILSLGVSGINILIRYLGINVTNENNLKLYRCENYNKTLNRCDSEWGTVSSSRDTTNDFVSADITGFSVYTLGESQSTQQTTTTTTTILSQTTTTVQSDQQQSSGSGQQSGGSGGGGSGSGSNQQTTTTTNQLTTGNIQEETPQEETSSNNSQEQPEIQQESSTTTGFISFLQMNGWLFTILIPLPVVAFILYKTFTNRSTITYPTYKYHRYSFNNIKSSKRSKSSKKKSRFSKETRLII
jgi:hypothetical protein